MTVLVSQAEHLSFLVNSRARGWPGVFICLEGADCSGKDTQAQLLREGIGPNLCTIVRDPGTTILGEHLRDILKDPSIPLRTDEAIHLFTLARSSLTRHIVELMTQGQFVISTRWVLSTLVYQVDTPAEPADPRAAVAGAAPNTPEAVVVELHHRCVGLAPDLTFLLDIPVGLGEARLKAKQSGERHEDLARYAARVHAYRRRCYQAGLPDELIIDANNSPEAMHEAICAGMPTAGPLYKRLEKFGF